MSEEIFQRYGQYYDLLYGDKDYAAESEYAAEKIRTAVPQARELLELGSGTGRHGRHLARLGFNVLGVERSEAMVAAALSVSDGPNSSGGSFKCREGDIRTVKVDSVFDAVVSLFHVVSYQVSNEDVLSTFETAAHHLRPGGIFLFDVWHGPAVLGERPAVRVKRAKDESTKLIRIAEPELDTNASVVTVQYTMLAESRTESRLTSFEEKHRMRYFFPSEIDLLARQTGFSVILSEEFLTGRTPSEHTWGVAYLLRKHA